MADLPEDRIKHLEMIQDVIARMAGESARMKQFALTVVGIVTSATVATHAPSLASVAGGLSFLFWLLDARYLQQERWYRALYDQVRIGTGSADFCLTPEAALRHRHSFWSVFFRWSVAPLYLVLIAIAVVLGRFVGGAA